MKKILLLFISVFLLFTYSCDKNEEAIISSPDITDNPQDSVVDDTSATKPISFLLPNTIATIDVGVYMKYSDSPFSVSDNIYNNVKLTNTNGIWTSSEPMSWASTWKCYDFIAYLPYKSTIENINAVPINIESDQSIESNKIKSDFMWGKTEAISPQISTPSITLNHMLSQANIRFKKKNLDYSQMTVNFVEVKTSGFVNFADGSLDIDNSTENVRCFRNYDNSYTAILMPQSIIESCFLKIKYNGVTYTYEGSIQFESQKIYNITISDIVDGHIELETQIMDWKLASETFGDADVDNEKNQ